jgi:hypothetical protein
MALNCGGFLLIVDNGIQMVQRCAINNDGLDAVMPFIHSHSFIQGKPDHGARRRCRVH